MKHEVPEVGMKTPANFNVLWEGSKARIVRRHSGLTARPQMQKTKRSHFHIL